MGLALSPPFVGWTGSSERGALDESVFLSAKMVLAWKADPIGLDGVDRGSYDANDGSIWSPEQRDVGSSEKSPAFSEEVRMRRWFHPLYSMGAVGLAAAWALAGCVQVHDVPEVIVGGLDYAFELDATFDAGPMKIGFENRGEVPHELVLARLRPGITLLDMISGMMEGGDPKEFSDGLGGILVADPGEVTMGRLYVELESGRSYALICMFRDQEGDPAHVALGMVRSFSVE